MPRQEHSPLIYLYRIWFKEGIWYSKRTAVRDVMFKCGRTSSGEIGRCLGKEKRRRESVENWADKIDAVACVSIKRLRNLSCDLSTFFDIWWCRYQVTGPTYWNNFEHILSVYCNSTGCEIMSGPETSVIVICHPTNKIWLLKQLKKTPIAGETPCGNAKLGRCVPLILIVCMFNWNSIFHQVLWMPKLKPFCWLCNYSIWQVHYVNA